MKKVLLIALFLLVLPVLHAEIDVVTYSTQNTFAMSSSGQSSLALCQCESFVDTVTITNTGVFANRYTFSHSLPAFVSASEAEVNLNPGQSRVITVLITAPCSGSLDDPLLYQVTDVFGNSQVIEKSLFSGQCQNLEAVLVRSDGIIDPCRPVTFELYVTNSGLFLEEYYLHFDSPHIDVPEQSLVLQPGAVGVGNVTFLTSCGLSGNFTVPVRVETKNSLLTAKLQSQVHVRKNYPFTVEASFDDMCAQDNAVFGVLITNDAHFDNSFSVSLNAPAFGSLNQTSVNLAPGQSKTVLISFAPALQDIGSLEASVEVTSALGGVKQTVPIKVSVLRCHDIAVDIDLLDDVNACSGYFEFPLVVANNGLVDETIVLVASGSEYVHLSETSLTLSAGQTKNSTLVAAVPTTVDVHAQVFVRAFSSANDQVFAEDVFRLSLTNLYGCSEVVFATAPVAKYHHDHAVFTLKNIGTKGAEYSLEMNGNDWLALTEGSLFIPAGGKVAFDVLTYQSNVTDTPAAAQSGVLRLTADTGIVYDVPFVLTLEPKGSLQLAAEYLWAHPCYLVSLLLVLFIIIAVLILILRSKRRYVSRKKLALALLVIWIVIVALVVVFSPPRPLYDPLPLAQDELVFVMAEDTSLTLNVSVFFSDPDGDVLMFSLDEPLENISVVTKGPLMRFVPDKDWFGQRRFRLVASDGAEQTRSPRMYLQVVDRPEYSLSSLYVRYCPLVNLVLLLCAFLCTVLLFSWKKRAPMVKKKTKRKRR